MVFSGICKSCAFSAGDSSYTFTCLAHLLQAFDLKKDVFEGSNVTLSDACRLLVSLLSISYYG